MKTLGIIMSLLLGMIFLPDAQGQYCNNDYNYKYDYYHNNNRDNYYRYHKKHYKKSMTLRGFERRIVNGIRTGELTRKESRKLHRKFNDLLNYRDYILRDGYITRHERRKFEKKKFKLDNLIWKKKHNHRKRH